MKSGVLLLLCSVLLAVFLQGVVSLPPDFFRTGRGNMIKLPPHKKSVDDMQVQQLACKFCKGLNQDYGDDCENDGGAMRRICLLALSAAVQESVEKLTNV